MGATTEDTQHEIGALRSDFSAALAELQRRVTSVSGLVGGFGSGGSTGASDVAPRPRTAMPEREPGMVSVGSVAAVATVGFAAWKLLERFRAPKTPKDKLLHRAEAIRDDAEERLEKVRDQARELRKRGVVVRYADKDGTAAIRITDAEGKPLVKKKRSRKDVLKNILWAVLLSLFMAAGSVLARRAADLVWKSTLQEDPPTEKDKKSAKAES